MSVTNGVKHDCKYIEYHELKDILRDGKAFDEDVRITIEYIYRDTVFGRTMITDSHWYEVINVKHHDDYTYLDKIKQCPFCDEILRRPDKMTAHKL